MTGLSFDPRRAAFAGSPGGAGRPSLPFRPDFAARPLHSSQGGLGGGGSFASVTAPFSSWLVPTLFFPSLVAATAPPPSAMKRASVATTFA